jgi:hypothetical protein
LVPAEASRSHPAGGRSEGDQTNAMHRAATGNLYEGINAEKGTF